MLTTVKQDEMVADTLLRSHLAFLINFTLGGKCSLHNSENRVVVERRVVEGKKTHKQIDFLSENAKIACGRTCKHKIILFIPELKRT